MWRGFKCRHRHFRTSTHAQPKYSSAWRLRLKPYIYTYIYIYTCIQLYIGTVLDCSSQKKRTCLLVRVGRLDWIVLGGGEVAVCVRLNSQHSYAREETYVPEVGERADKEVLVIAYRVGKWINESTESYWYSVVFSNLIQLGTLTPFIFRKALGVRTRNWEAQINGKKVRTSKGVNVGDVSEFESRSSSALGGIRNVFDV